MAPSATALICGLLNPETASVVIAPICDDVKAPTWLVLRGLMSFDVNVAIFASESVAMAVLFNDEMDEDMSAPLPNTTSS